MLSTIRTMGYVTKDPVLQEGKENRTKYVRLSLAVHKGYGEKRRTLFVQATFYRDKAEGLMKANVKKGSLVELAGDLEDILAFSAKDSGELVTMLKVAPYEWAYVPNQKAKEEEPESGKATEQAAPVIPEEAVCNEQDLPF